MMKSGSYCKWPCIVHLFLFARRTIDTMVCAYLYTNSVTGLRVIIVLNYVHTRVYNINNRIRSRSNSHLHIYNVYIGI